MLHCVKKWSSITSAVVALGLTSGTMADIIDFESGYSDGDTASSVPTATNTVTITGDDQGTPVTPTVIDNTGPHAGFVNVPLGSLGQYILTDEANNSSFLVGTTTWSLAFDVEIVGLNIDVVEYNEVVAGIDNDVTITAYGDAARTIVVDTDTVSFTTSDGVTNLAVAGDETNPIVLVDLEFTRRDRGLALDNIDFTTSPTAAIPEPASATLLGGIALVLLSHSWRRSA